MKDVFLLKEKDSSFCPKVEWLFVSEQERRKE